MGTKRPPIVLVGGAPGSGKTTLAGLLAPDLGLPLLARDAIKEVLFDALGASDRSRSREIGIAAYSVLYTTATWLVDAGGGAVIESNFYRGRSELDLCPLIERAAATLVHCETGRDEIVRRYLDRYARGERHPGHHDDAAVHDLMTNLDAGVFEPLALDIPTLRVDTTADYKPSLETIARIVRRQS